MNKNTWKVIALALLLNFSVWAFIAFAIGGSAAGGRSDETGYWLKNRKGEKETSKEIYYYSLIHTYFVYGTGPICLFAVFQMNRRKK